MTKYCSKCGTPNEDDAQFCNKCGAALPISSQSQNTSQQSSQNQPSSNQYLLPKRSSKKWWIIGIAIVIVVIIIAVIAINDLNQSSSTVTVTAVDLSVVYNGLTSGYLGPTSQSLNGFTISPGSSFSYSITFTSSAALLSHSINSIYTTTPGFSIISISPNLPYSFSPGSTFTITIIIQAPNTAYNGVLQLTVTTS
ncbi:MAG: zinc ribbon domain-containing protein [Metallosphaera sp.]